MHKTIVCSCGKQISTCRCPSPNKTIVVSDQPCTHVKTEVQPSSEEVYAKYADIFGVPSWLFKEVIAKYNEEILQALVTEARDKSRSLRGE